MGSPMIPVPIHASGGFSMRASYEAGRRGALSEPRRGCAAGIGVGRDGGSGDALGGLAGSGGVRAIYAEVAAKNSPAQQLLERLGFTLSGFDERRRSNHDLVKETATLLWYLELEA